MVRIIESKDPFDVAPVIVGRKDAGGKLTVIPTTHDRRDPGMGALFHTLGAYDPNKGATFYTKKGADETQGTLNRNIPLRNFMPFAREIHEMATPGTDNRTMLVLGDPGTGKTKNAMGAARVYGDMEFAACDTETRSQDLLTEIVFSPEQGGPTLEERIDEILAKINGKMPRDDGKPHTLSVAGEAALRQLKGFSETEGVYAMNWQAVKTGLSDNTTDPATSNIIGRLEDFLKAQGQPIGAQNVEVKKVDGPIIRAVKQGKPVIFLDEFTRLRNYEAMFGPLEVFTGMKDEHTIKDAEGNDIVLRKGKVPLLLITGNMNDAGVTLLRDSPVFSRVRQKNLELPSDITARIAIFQQAIEAQISGLPVSLMDEVVRGKNPTTRTGQEAAAFAHVLEQYAKHGLDAEDRLLYPHLQTQMVLNADRLAHASHNLAKFCTALQDRLHPGNPAFRNATAGALNFEIGRHMLTQPIKIDLRTPQKWISDALRPKADVIAPGAAMQGYLFDNDSLPDSPKETVLEKRFGSDLTTAIVEWRDNEILAGIKNDTIRIGIRNIIDDELRKCQVILHPGHTPDQMAGLVESQLTIDPNRRTSLDVQAPAVREALFREAGLNPGDDRDKYLPLSVVNGLLHDLQLQVLRKNANPELLTIHPRIASDPSNKFVTARVAHKESERMDISQRISAEGLLKSFTLPGIGVQNFERSFTRDVTEYLQKNNLIEALDKVQVTLANPWLFFPTGGNTQFTVNILEVLENRSSTGLAVNVISTRNARNLPVDIQIWRNNNTNQTVIVGDSIDDELKRKLESTSLGITYVDRTQRSAMDILKEKLDPIFDQVTIPVGWDAIQAKKIVKDMALNTMCIRKRPLLHCDPEHLRATREATIKEVNAMGTKSYALQNNVGYDMCTDPTRGLAGHKLKSQVAVTWAPVIPCVMLSKSIS